MQYQLAKASNDDKSVIYNMMQLYYHELSSYEDESAIFELNIHGKYDSKYFDYFWVEENRFPYLLKEDNKYVGFALVRKNEYDYIEFSEFFVLNKYKGKGAGRFMAKSIFDLHKGNWEIRTLVKNIPAQNFWRKIVNEKTNRKCEEKYIRDNTRLAWYFSNN